MPKVAVPIHRAATLLSEVVKRAGPKFVGTGLIVSDYPDELPVYPISLDPLPKSATPTAEILSLISRTDHPLHDGFHVVSSDFKILRLSQYFATPIIKDAQIDRSKRFGGRYLAALFGSALPNVLLVGIASPGFGKAVFVDGNEVHYEIDCA